MNEFDRDPGIVPAASPPDTPPERARPGPFHHGLVSRLRNYFLTGLILVAPAYITISLTWWFINWVDDLVRPFIRLAYRGLRSAAPRAKSTAHRPASSGDTEWSSKRWLSPSRSPQ
jgi:hypothetical protein